VEKRCGRLWPDRSVRGQVKPEGYGYADGPFNRQHQSSSPQQRERARKYTLTGQSAFVATRDLITLLLVQFIQPGWSAWKKSERDQRRVIILVVGVTPHQGDGSAVTGRRITGNFVQA
jgi:hypothetical protein